MNVRLSVSQFLGAYAAARKINSKEGNARSVITTSELEEWISQQYGWVPIGWRDVEVVDPARFTLFLLRFPDD